MKKILGLGALSLFAFAANAQNLKSALKLTDNERFELADAEYRKLIQAEPTNGDNYYFLGDNFFKWELNNMIDPTPEERAAEKYDSARFYFERGAAINATNPINYVGLGKIRLFQGKKEEGESLLFKAYSLYQTQGNQMAKEKKVVLLQELAEALIRAPKHKNIDKAVQYLAEAEKLEPSNAETALILGDAYLEKYGVDASMAIKQYEKAFNLDKSTVKAILRTGQVLSSATAYDLAYEKYKEALQIDSTFGPAYREIAEMLYKSRKYGEAVKTYRKYLSLNNSPSARDRYAKFIFLTKDYKTAVEEIQEVQKIDSSSVVMYRLLGYSFVEIKDCQKGLDNIQKFFSKQKAAGKPEIVPSDYAYKARAHACLDQDSLAMIEFEKAVAADTSKTDFLFEAGFNAYKLKDYNKAASMFEKKVNKGKGDVNDYQFLGRSYYNLGEYVKADTVFSQMISKYPTISAGYLWRAYTYGKMDKGNKEGLAKPHYEKAIEVLKAELEKSPNPDAVKKSLVQAYFYLASYYTHTKKEYNCGKFYWEKIQELDPDHKGMKDALSSPVIKAATSSCEAK